VPTGFKYYFHIGIVEYLNIRIPGTALVRMVCMVMALHNLHQLGTVPFPTGIFACKLDTALKHNNKGNN